ncbi:hypothetical protein QUB34_30950 [Microcoleus sp. AT9b-C5]
MKRVILAIAFLCSGCGASAQLNAAAECRADEKDPINIELKELYGRATSVFIGRATVFGTSETIFKPFGIYKVERLRDFKKGNADISPFVEIIGSSPLEFIPQYYFDASERHRRNFPNFSPSYHNKVQIGDTCEPFFSGVIGYHYVFFMKNEKLLAFEVVNDLGNDDVVKGLRQLSAVAKVTQ